MQALRLGPWPGQKKIDWRLPSHQTVRPNEIDGEADGNCAKDPLFLEELKGDPACQFELPHWLGPGGTRRRASRRLGAGRARRFRFTRRPCVFLFDVGFQSWRLDRPD